MNKPATIWQIVAVVSALVIAIVTGWVTLTNEVSAIKAKQESESNRNYMQQIEADKKFDKIDGKIDQLNNTSTQILIELQKKEDRK